MFGLHILYLFYKIDMLIKYWKGWLQQFLAKKPYFEYLTVQKNLERLPMWIYIKHRYKKTFMECIKENGTCACIVKTELKHCFTSYKVLNYFTAERIIELLVLIVFTDFIVIRQKTNNLLLWSGKGIVWMWFIINNT